MPNRQQAAEAMKRAREIVSSRIRRNILIHNPRMSPEAIEVLVKDETTRALAPEVEITEGDFALQEWEADESGWRPRERSPRIKPPDPK